MNCSRCGAEIEEGAAVCRSCGQPVAAPLRDDGGSVEAGSTAVRRSVAYAGFWLRAVAYVIDSLLLGLVVSVIILVPLMRRGVIPADNPWVLLTGTGRHIVAANLLVIMASWLYFSLSESSRWQATPGKKLLGLYVTDLAGQRISFARASGRYFGKILSGIPFFLGFAMAAVTARKQALHDLLASCLVVRRI